MALYRVATDAPEGLDARRICVARRPSWSGSFALSCRRATCRCAPGPDRADEPAVNAIVTLLPERAQAQADADDALARRGDAAARTAHRAQGPGLHGGIRTTFGSDLADWVPDKTTCWWGTRAAGAILWQTNTPEFGAGSHTSTRVRPTRNPYTYEGAGGRREARRGRRMRDAAIADGRLRRVAPHPRFATSWGSVHARTRSVMAPR